MKKKEKKERKPNWKEYIASVEDIERYLDDRVMLRYNVVTHRIEYREWSDEKGVENPWLPLGNRQVKTWWKELSREKSVRLQDIQNVAESNYAPDYHPFRHYLEHLPPWDGTSDHILAMSMSVQVKGDTDKQLLFAQYLKKWLVAMVASWVDDNVVNNVILVLIGPQGSYKTTWFNYLLPPELRSYFYTKTNAQRMTKDDMLTLAQYGLVCCEELDTMRPQELNQLKAAVTMSSVNERAPYDRYPENRKHIASFCGTGNNTQFLSDPTGNRRWLPFEIESIDSPREYPFEYAEIYAQAYALYRQGFQYWFSQEEIQRLAAHNRQFETPRLENELVQLYFRKPTGVEPGMFMSVARAMQIVSANISQKLSAVYLGRALNESGFRRVKYNGVRGYIVVCRNGDEIHAAQQSMAMQAESEEGSLDSSGQYF